MSGRNLPSLEWGFTCAPRRRVGGLISTSPSLKRAQDDNDGQGHGPFQFHLGLRPSFCGPAGLRQIEMHGRRNEQGQDHRDQDAAHYGNGERLEHLRTGANG